MNDHPHLIEIETERPGPASSATEAGTASPASPAPHPALAATLAAARAEVHALTLRLHAADQEIARAAEALRLTRLDLVHHMRDHSAIMARWEQLFLTLRDQAASPPPPGRA